MDTGTPMLEQALKSKLPFVHVTTSDLLHISEVLSFIAGETVYPLQQNPDGSLGSLKHSIYYTAAELATPTMYLEFKSAGKCLVFVNTKSSVLHFVGGLMLPPRAMMLNYLRDLMDDSENAEVALPAFSGMTLKEMYEATRITLKRAGKVTAKDINETRQGYISRLKGIVQVDTKPEFYQCPSYLEDWMKVNSQFFIEPVLPSLTPRGLLLDGIPGTGKTSGAKYLAHQWGLPLYHLDMGSIKGKYVGESEASLSAALSQIDQVSPCVVGDTVIRISDTVSITAKKLWETQTSDVKTHTISEEGETVPTTITGVIRRDLNKDRYLLTIVDETGNIITVTDNHKLLVKENNVLIWKEASALSENDELVKW